MRSAHERDELVAQLERVALGAGLQHDEAQRHLAAQVVGHAEDGALGDVGVRRDDLLHRAGREAVAGDVDDVVDAAHHEHVAVLVDVPAVARQVPAGIALEIRRSRSGRRRSRASAESPGGSGSRIAIAPCSPVRNRAAVGVEDVDAVAGHGAGSATPA